MISRQYQILVYGLHSKDWNDALAPGAATWDFLAVDVTQISAEGPNQLLDTLAHFDSEGRLDCIVIPVLDPQINMVLQAQRIQRERNGPPILSLIPSLDALEVFSHKDKFARYVKEHKLESYVPKTYEASVDLSTLPYPCVLKRTDLNDGYGIMVAHSKQDIESALLIEPWKDSPFIIQEYMSEDREYVTHAVMKNGKFLIDVTYENLYSQEYYCKSTRCCPHTVNKFKLTTTQKRILESILKPLAYTGPCNIDYKINAQGVPQIMEVNPRLGGSLMKMENREDLKIILSTIVKAASYSNSSPYGYRIKNIYLNIAKSLRRFWNKRVSNPSTGPGLVCSQSLVE